MIDQNAISLTSREIEVLRLVAEGNANKQSAAILGISIKTIEKHRGALARKLGIHNTAGLTRYAISWGIIECNLEPSVAMRPPMDHSLSPGENWALKINRLFKTPVGITGRG